MTKSQLKGMIKFHRKAEKAFRSVGKIESADSARVHRYALLLQLQAMIKAIRA